MKLPILRILISRTRKCCANFWLACDAIKFARIAAGRTESEALFEQASGFVEEVK